MKFGPTHEIMFCGFVIQVWADLDEKGFGALYTEAEWHENGLADWELTPQGLTFEGEPASGAELKERES